MVNCSPSAIMCMTVTYFCVSLLVVPKERIIKSRLLQSLATVRYPANVARQRARIKSLALSLISSCENDRYSVTETWTTQESNLWIASHKRIRADVSAAGAPTFATRISTNLSNSLD